MHLNSAAHRWELASHVMFSWPIVGHPNDTRSPLLWNRGAHSGRAINHVLGLVSHNVWTLLLAVSYTRRPQSSRGLSHTGCNVHYLLFASCKGALATVCHRTCPRPQK